MSSEVDLGITYIARQGKQIIFSWERTKSGLEDSDHLNE